MAAMSEDVGYFPKGESILREVQEERAVGLLYGQRALMLGAMMHPLAYYGTAEHTHARLRPFQRLAHTAKVFETTFFGTRAEADKSLAFVRRMHERVKGTIAHDLGPWPAGTPYSALDPDEMLWGVVANTFDSSLVVHEALVRRLSDDEREQLWQEYVSWGELFGMPRSVAPKSYPEFRRAWEERLHGEQAFLTDEARLAGYETGFGIPVPAVDRPALKVLELVLNGTLPERVREAYGLSWSFVDQAAYEAFTLAVRNGLPFVPGLARRGTCNFFFDLVANTERSRLSSGQVPKTFEVGHA